MSKKILLVNLNWIGDVLFSTPAIRALRKANPGSYIACVTHARCQALLKNNPHLNEVLTPSPGAYFKILNGKFDTAIFFHPSRTKALWARLAGIPERIGYATAKNKKYLTRAVPMPTVPLHKTDLLLNLLKECGMPSDGRQTELFLNADAESSFQALLRAHAMSADEPYVVVHAGGNWDLKRWPAGHFINWIKIFLQKRGHKVILIGTKAEERLTDAIRMGVDDKRVLSLCGKTSLDQLALLMKHARLVLSNDSGPIHVAASQGARILGLFGPTQPALTGPVMNDKSRILFKDVGCEVPCYFKSCDYRVCMDWLEPSEVYEAAAEMLGGP